ncbi:MAG: hypothetical protein GY789_24085 [Hyphomicrobiales bacterium]|nr:hypothetical protein [Hyphomicrobiales bacterium]MCP5000624.1 hypothetical protein [Hyphomicrobiales bacterium]
MTDETAQPEDNTAAPTRAHADNRAVYASLAAVAVIFGLIIGWQWWQISTLKGELSALRELTKSAQQNDALLAETINSNQEVLIEQFSTLSSGLENKIVSSASKQLDRSLTDAIDKLSAFGNARFAFQMVEYDRRSCANGGVFTGKHLEGEQQEEPFQAGAMVEVQPTHTDIRGIPFYRVSIGEVLLQWQGSDAEFRHGSMRIACN